MYLPCLLSLEATEDGENEEEEEVWETASWETAAKQRKSQNDAVQMQGEIQRQSSRGEDKKELLKNRQTFDDTIE